MSDVTPEVEPLDLRAFVQNLPLWKAEEIFNDYESLMDTGSTGQSVLRLTTQEYLNQIAVNTRTPPVAHVGWMRTMSEEVMIRLVRHYRSRSGI